MDSNKERLTGKVIWFSGSMGFICPDGKKEGEADVFVHYSQIVMTDEGAYKTLEPKTKVSFAMGQNHKGVMAIDVTKVDEGKKS